MQVSLAAIRFLHFAAAFILFGSIAFRMLIAAGGVRALVAPRLVQWERNAVGIAAVSAILWLALAVAGAGDGLASAADPAMVGRFLTSTYFGRVWLLRLGLLACLLALMFGGRNVSDVVLLVLAGVLVATLGWIGHPASHDGLIGLLHCANYSVHATAAALWVGALPALALALALGKSEELRLDLAATVRRFSHAGYLAVPLVLMTGMIGTWSMLGTWPVWSASPYQFWLAAKLVLVTLMLIFAAANRFVFTPALVRRPGMARRAILTLALAEVVLGYGVLALVAHFGMLSPMGD